MLNLNRFLMAGAAAGVLLLGQAGPFSASAGPLLIGPADNGNGNGQTGKAKVLKGYTVKNQTGETAKDYHITLEHENGEKLNVRNTPVFGQGLAGTEATSFDTNKETIDINFDVTVPAGTSGTVIIDLFQENQDIKVIKSNWTSKDTDGNSVNIGEVRIPGFAADGGEGATNGGGVEEQANYTIRNDFETPIGIGDLQFLFNVPELDPDSIDPGMIPDFGLPEEDFILGPLSTQTFTFADTLDPNNFIYAQGRVFDIVGSGSGMDGMFGEEIALFIHGHQEAPEPALLSLLIPGLVGVAAVARLRRRA